MATAATPYGLRPTNIIGGQSMSHGFRQYKITASYATSIFQGDVVKLVIGGTCEKDTGTTAATPVGVFWGVEYEDPSMGLLFKNSWTASTVIKSGTTAWAYVYDDPDMLFEIQANGSLGQNAIGVNAALVQGSGNTATGISGVSLNASTMNSTATFPLRVVDYVNKAGFSTLGDAYTDLIVRFVTHERRTALGLTLT